MESLVKGDVFKYVIAKNLKKLDLFNLAEGLKDDKSSNTDSKEIKILDIIKFQTVLELEKRLAEEFFEKFLTPINSIYLEFKKLLENTGSVISGSFILQCILDEYWENSDIDIFVPMIGNKITKTKCDNVMSEIDDFLFSGMNFINYIAADRYGNNIDNKIRFIRTFQKNRDSKYKIQVILVEVKKEELHDFIIDNFDFDVCKNILSFSSTKNKELYIHKLNEVLTKKTYFKVGNRIGSTIDRCERYQKRGFSFGSKNLSIDKLKELMTEGDSYIRFLSSIEKLDLLNKRNCYNCAINFCRPEVAHFHFDGEHMGGGRYEDLIFIDSMYA